MAKSRVNVLGAVVVIALLVGMTQGCLGIGERSACGCSYSPRIVVDAEPTAARFESLVRSGDVDGAWAMMTHAARIRYGDVAGFRPVAQRLAVGYAASAQSRWILFSPLPSSPVRMGGMLARLAAAEPLPAAAFTAPQMMMVLEESPGQVQADPEPTIREIRAYPYGPGLFRLENTETDASGRPESHWPWSRLGILLVDPAGELVHTWSTSPGIHTVSRRSFSNPVLVLATGTTDGLTWWAGTTTLTVEI
jgi:hypothetical protein